MRQRAPRHTHDSWLTVPGSPFMRCADCAATEEIEPVMSCTSKPLSRATRLSAGIEGALELSRHGGVGRDHAAVRADQVVVVLCEWLSASS